MAGLTLPAGAFFLSPSDSGVALLKGEGRILRWSHSGYEAEKEFDLRQTVAVSFSLLPKRILICFRGDPFFHSYHSRLFFVRPKHEL